MLNSFKILLTKDNTLYPISELSMVLIFADQEAKKISHNFRYSIRNVIYFYEHREEIWVVYFAKAIMKRQSFVSLRRVTINKG